MNRGDWIGIAMACFVILSIVLIVYVSGYTQGVKAERREWMTQAIECGCAEYRCDPKTGETEFVWKRGE